MGRYVCTYLCVSVCKRACTYMQHACMAVWTIGWMDQCVCALCICISVEKCFETLDAVTLVVVWGFFSGLDEGCLHVQGSCCRHDCKWYCYCQYMFLWLPQLSFFLLLGMLTCSLHIVTCLLGLLFFGAVCFLFFENACLSLLFSSQLVSFHNSVAVLHMALDSCLRLAVRA